MREQLTELAYDLWWSGIPGVNELWRDLDPALWDDLNHSPVAMLRELETIPASWLEKAAPLLQRWEAMRQAPPLPNCPAITYLCMEFGIHESLPIYSGGLGILAGDHIRSAADLGMNFVGVGLFYREGYFYQVLHEGQQSSAYPCRDPADLALRPVLDEDGEPLKVSVPFGNETMAVQAWEARLAGVRLYLLDTNLPENNDEMRDLTRRLYSGGQRTRIGQEILLGIGGIRLMKALGRQTDVFHMNEGHAAFSVLELWADGMRDGLSRQEAWTQTEQQCVFTTHTPVPAGHDRFWWESVNKLLGPYRTSLSLREGTFMDLGREEPGNINTPLSMTVLALRGSRAANGVSALHGEVSREMFADLGFQIDHITNGVHPGAWLAPEMEAVFDDHLPGWREHHSDEAFWGAAEDLPRDALLTARRSMRGRLIEGVRRRLGRAVLDPDALTIGFARRFAPYKRGDLIFTDPDRLAALLDQGVQIVYGGKAHPKDVAGQAIIARVLRWARDPRFRNRVILIPNYEADFGRLMTQGCDVWLNNPRRPREASGTSGQKAALNGNPNCSVLDGWWPEAYDGRNGWAVGTTRDWTDTEAQDAADVESLYGVLTNEILPTFQQPEKWGDIMAHTIATCMPVFNTHRMVLDYLKNMYRAEQSDEG